MQAAYTSSTCLFSQNPSPKSLSTEFLVGYDKAKSLRQKAIFMGQNMEGVWLSVFWSIINN